MHNIISFFFKLLGALAESQSSNALKPNVAFTLYELGATKRMMGDLEGPNNFNFQEKRMKKNLKENDIQNCPFSNFSQNFRCPC